MSINFTIKKCPTHCDHCGTEFTEDNPAVDCHTCDCPTICNACAEKHGTCKCAERNAEHREWECDCLRENYDNLDQ